jgi:hypothetical protein
MSQVLVLLMKSADISVEVRPFAVADRWVDLLLEEFGNQVDCEQRQGLVRHLWILFMKAFIAAYGSHENDQI